TLIIPAICAGIVFGIKELFWKEKVPNIVEKLRWLIAIVVAITINIIGALLNANMQITPFIAAGLLVLIIMAFKNEKIQNLNNTPFVCPVCNNDVSADHKYCT